jgi:hypothetical protein
MLDIEGLVKTWLNKGVNVKVTVAGKKPKTGIENKELADRRTEEALNKFRDKTKDDKG